MISSINIKRKRLFWDLPPSIFWVVGILLAVVILAVPLPMPRHTPVERHIYIEASSFAYTPERIRVEPGDKVTIDLMATDVIHGIYIDGYNLEASADPGQIAQISFTADQPGLFRFRCAVPCGAMHPFMIGKLQVGPNLLLIRAIVLIILSGIFLAIWLQNRKTATS